MSMKLNDLDFIRLLPLFMRDDAAVQGLAKGLDEIIPQLSESVKHLTTWDHIDQLSETELDELAWELSILWYDHAADIAAKRDVVKNSDKVYQHLGTKWAVENVIRSYFGNGHIKEWFEYDGEPGRFRIHSTNPEITGPRLAAFLNLVYKVKRASAKLEAVYIDLESSGAITYGAASEMAGHMDVWPLVIREIESTGALTYGAANERTGRLKVYPLAAKSIETSGESGITGAQVYGLTLEIYPQGGNANG